MSDLSTLVILVRVMACDSGSGRLWAYRTRRNLKGGAARSSWQQPTTTLCSQLPLKDKEEMAQGMGIAAHRKAAT